VTDLSKEDWQFIEYAVAKRFRDAGSKKGEPPNSKEFKDQEARIMDFLFKKAFRSGA
jgi:hypothetical protein